MDRLLSLLLIELDGVQTNTGPPVLLLGVCLSPSLLDPAILRPGRLDVHVPVLLPTIVERVHILERILSSSPVAWEQAEV